MPGISRVVFRVIILLTCIQFVFPGIVQANSKQIPITSAQSALLIDTKNGQILYEKNHLIKRPIASTTKVMTAIIALAGADTNSMVTISPRAAAIGESTMDLQEGEILRLEDLLYGALMRSGNDACVAIAEHVAGSEEKFIMLMNEKSIFMGAHNTSFRNANGLPAKGHYSTANDLALITRNALKSDTFREIIKTRYKTVSSTEEDRHSLYNTNKLLWNYPWADGVKTGTTNEAGKCLIASASKEDRSLLAVILNGEDRFNDAVKLLEFGFNDYKKVIILYGGEVINRIYVKNGKQVTVPVMAKDDVVFNLRSAEPDSVAKIIELPDYIDAPVKKGDKLGKVSIFINGSRVASSDIIAAASVSEAALVDRIIHAINSVVIK